MTLRHFAWSLALGLALTGCKTTDDTDPDTDTDTDTDTTVEVDEFEVLVDYMATENLDLPAMLTDWVKNPQDIFDAGVENYFIIDIRTGDKYEVGVNDFEEGHIAGAHSVALADVVTYEAANNTSDLPVLVVCYTGQTAGHAAMSLRLMGVEAYVLKWGMSGWHSDFDVYMAGTGNAALDYPDVWVDTAIDDPTPFTTFPVLDTGFSAPADILAARIDGAVLDGFNSKSIADVFAAPEDFYIVNFWNDPEIALYGHIDGAVQIAPGEIKLDNLDLIDPEKPVIIYCWTGQTASMVAAWLSVLGYDAYALLFSANGIVYDELQANKFTGALDLAYETGA